MIRFPIFFSFYPYVHFIIFADMTLFLLFFNQCAVNFPRINDDNNDDDDDDDDN